MTFGEQRRVVGEWPLRRGLLLRLPSKRPHPTFEETTLPQCGRLVRAPGLLLIALHVAWGSAITIKRSTFMTKEIRFCLKADEAPSSPGAYAIAIELADTVTVTLNSWAPIVLPAARYLYCGSARMVAHHLVLSIWHPRWWVRWLRQL